MPDSASLLAALRERVVVADGAMGTMLQAAQLTLDDFEGHEGCNEILNVTRPDVVRSIHDGYLAVGCDAVETNTFGVNLANLAEYGIADRIYELARAGARGPGSRCVHAGEQVEEAGQRVVARPPPVVDQVQGDLSLLVRDPGHRHDLRRVHDR